MTTDAKVQIGNSTEFLEGTSVTTTAGANLFREGVVISDPELPGARAEVRPISAALTGDDYGLITHSIIQGHSTAHGGEYVDVKVNPSGSLQTEVTGTVSISGTVNVAEPISVENTQATPLFVRDEHMHGVWGYVSGIDGTPIIPANAYILQIAVVSPTATASTFTINGGSVITVPPAQSLTIEPRGLVATPTIVFTGTASYFIEYAVH